MFWLILANALLIPAWAIVPLGVNLIRNARAAPTIGRQATVVMAGLILLGPALLCSAVFVLDFLVNA